MGGARAELINSGHDTRITLSDGSTIVFKGVTHVDAIFWGAAAKASAGDALPIGGNVGCDGERAHHRGHSREGLHGVAE